MQPFTISNVIWTKNKFSSKCSIFLKYFLVNLIPICSNEKGIVLTLTQVIFLTLQQNIWIFVFKTVIKLLYLNHQWVNQYTIWRAGFWKMTFIQLKFSENFTKNGLLCWQPGCCFQFCLKNFSIIKNHYLKEHVTRTAKFVLY